jgi:hypothetical protein
VLTQIAAEDPSLVVRFNHRLLELVEATLMSQCRMERLVG